MSVVRKATMPTTAIATAAGGGAGPGLDPAPGPEEEGILAHAVEAVVGGQGQLPTAGPGQSLLVGIDHFHLADHGLAL